MVCSKTRCTLWIYSSTLSLSLSLSVCFLLSINSCRLQLPLFSKARQSCCSLISLPSVLPSSTMRQQFLNCTGNEVSPPCYTVVHPTLLLQKRERGSERERPRCYKDTGSVPEPFMIISLTSQLSSYVALQQGEALKERVLMAKAPQDPHLNPQCMAGRAACILIMSAATQTLQISPTRASESKRLLSVSFGSICAV